MKRIILFFVLFNIFTSLSFAGPDDETCSGIRSYAIYEVGRTAWTNFTFINVPGLANGDYLAQKVTLQYAPWHYGATDDRSSTPEHENWDNNYGKYPFYTVPHIVERWSGTVSHETRDTDWEYVDRYGGGDGLSDWISGGFLRYSFESCIISEYRGKLCDQNWANLPSQTDATLHFRLGARGKYRFLRKNKKGYINVGYKIYQYKNSSGGRSGDMFFVRPKLQFESQPIDVSGIYGGGLESGVDGVVDGSSRFVELLSYNNNFAVFRTYYYVVYKKISILGITFYVFQGRYPQENDMPVTFNATSKFRVAPPTLNTPNSSKTGIITISGQVGEIVPYNQTIKIYEGGNILNEFGLSANTTYFMTKLVFTGEQEHSIYATAGGRSGFESRDSNLVSVIVDVIPPEIKNLNISRNPFGPQSSSETYRTTTITANVVDEHPYSWKVEIKQNDTLVREYNYTGTDKNISVVWNGKNTAGNVVSSGLYKIIVTAMDAAGNTSTRIDQVNDEFNDPFPEPRVPNKYLWTKGYTAMISEQTSGIVIENTGKLKLFGNSISEGNVGEIFLRSNGKVNFEGGLTIEVPMEAPANSSTYKKVYSEFYIHEQLLTDTQPYYSPSWIRFSVRSSGDSGIPKYHWLVQRYKEGFIIPGWFLTSFQENITGPNIDRGTWYITITTTTLFVKLILGNGATYEDTAKHEMPFSSAYLYYGLRTTNTTSYSFFSDYLRTSVRPTWTTVAVDKTNPAVVSAITGISGYYPGYVNLQWTPPGDDGTIGNVSAYEVRYNNYNISGDTVTWWNNATVLNQNWTSADNDKIVTGLTPGVIYYFVIRGRDDVWNLSDMPNSVSPVVASTQNLVYINELMPSDPGSGDWFELKNEWTRHVNLESWRFYTSTTDIKWTGTADNQIQTNNLFVSPQTLNLAKAKNTTFYIENNFGVIVDKIILGAEVSVGSYSRFIYENKILYETDPTPTKGLENTVSNEVVKINEVLYKSGTTEPWGPQNAKQYEFIELFNTDTVSTKTLTYWSLRNTYKTPFFLPVFNISPNSFNSINAGSYGLTASTDTGAPSRSYKNAFGSSGLTGTSDVVVLENPSGQTVERITWGTPSVYYSSAGVQIDLSNPASGDVTAGKSIARQPDGYDTAADGSDFVVMTATAVMECSQNANAGVLADNDFIAPASSGSFTGSFDVTIKFGYDSSAYPADTIIFSASSNTTICDLYSPHVFKLADLGFNLSNTASSQTVSMAADTPDINGNYLADKVTYYVILNTDGDLDGRKSAKAIVHNSVYYKRAGPSRIADLSASVGPTDKEGTIYLNWTAPGADGTVGTASEYDLRYSTNVILSLTDFLASARRNISLPLASGSAEQVLVSGLVGNTTYYFRIRTKNSSVWSIFSNLASSTTQGDNIPPNNITDLTVVTGYQIKLTWTAPGDNRTVGNIIGGLYEIKYSSDSSNLEQYTIQRSTNLIAGQLQTQQITGLNPATTYYFKPELCVKRTFLDPLFVGNGF